MRSTGPKSVSVLHNRPIQFESRLAKFITCARNWSRSPWRLSSCIYSYFRRKNPRYRTMGNLYFAGKAEAVSVLFILWDVLYCVFFNMLLLWMNFSVISTKLWEWRTFPLLAVTMLTRLVTSSLTYKTCVCGSIVSERWRFVQFQTDTVLLWWV